MEAEYPRVRLNPPQRSGPTVRSLAWEQVSSNRTAPSSVFDVSAARHYTRVARSAWSLRPLDRILEGLDASVLR
jgi:hypothetical protein